MRMPLMPHYLLDSNTCIRYINGRSSSIRVRLQALTPDEVFVCSLVKAEMFAGALNSQEPERSLAKQRSFFADFESLDFDDKAAEAYAPVRAYLKRTGQMIGTNDLLIAAIAIANNLILVTHNTDEFQRVPGLIIEDWE
jgi:tRNA(fMet)-specific endonuclease VapC